jgi:hypothetical protein
MLSFLILQSVHTWANGTGHSSIGERRTTFAKTCEIEVRCYYECVGEDIANLGNLMGVHWELEENTLGAKGKMKMSSGTPLNSKEK